MNRRLRVAFCLYASAALLAFGAGITYLFRAEFMSFHELAVGQAWDTLPSRVQALVLTLMKAVGAAYVALAFAFAVLLAFPFRQSAGWANGALLVLGLTLAAGSPNAMVFLARATNTAQPVLGPLAAGALCLVAFVLGRHAHQRSAA